jgi:hypothetical protein
MAALLVAGIALIVVGRLPAPEKKVRKPKRK